MCSLPHCLCQQYWFALHNPLHKARNILRILIVTWDICYPCVSNSTCSHLFSFSHRSEEQCLVRSGLVQLMDSLCSLSGQRECSSNEKQTKKQKVATMAWAAFQVLANRCIEWEKVEGMWTHMFVGFDSEKNVCLHVFASPRTIGWW